MLRKGISVALDATNLEEHNREQLYHIADQSGARLVIVRMEAPPEVVQQRLERRCAERGPVGPFGGGLERVQQDEADGGEDRPQSLCGGQLEGHRSSHR